MLLFSILVIALITGLIRGGKLTNIISLRFQHPWLIFSSIVLEYGVLFLMRNSMIFSQTIVFYAILVQYLLLFLFFWYNKKLSYIWVIASGSFLNFLVIMLNQGSMPLTKMVLQIAASSKSLLLLMEGRYLTYHIIDRNTKLWFLGDIIYIPTPFKGFISIGDILLFSGVFLLMQKIIANKENS